MGLSSSPPKKVLLWVLLTLSSRASTGLALAIPAPTSGSDVSGLLKLPRAEEDFVTMYGLFDETPYSGAPSDGHPKLAPIGDVFLAMMTSTAPASAPTGSSQGHSQSGASTTDPAASATATGFSPLESPPPLGPGLVILASTTLPGFSAPSSSPLNNVEANSAGTSSSARASTPSRRIVILGSIIGSILFLTLCLFFLLDPAIIRRFRSCCRLRKRPARARKENKGISHTDSAWVKVTEPASPEHTLVEHDMRSSPSPEKDEKIGAGDTTLIEAPANAFPLSKFSVCSSECLDPSDSSRRDSTVASDYASTHDTVTPNFILPLASGPAPPRPPRPPTADSPALSDSVYLACSDQPYVIVVPQPITSADMMNSSSGAREIPRKFLTPSEFFALHAPIIPGAPSNKSIRASSAATREHRVSFQAGPKRDSVHSRTRSAPLLGLMQSARTSSRRNSGVIDYATSDSETSSSHGIVKRVLKHRRSRSASGWAYPDREQPKSKKFFNIEALSLNIR